MKRRDVLYVAGAASLAAAALAIKGYRIPSARLLRWAEAGSGLPLSSLRASLDPNECLLLLPSDPDYEKYQNAFNRRTALRPKARILVTSARGVVELVQWLKANRVPFSIRGGGHSYEGFSQSSSVVIDTRMLNKVELDASGQTVFVGGGAAVGDVYDVVGARQLAVPLGSCPDVGVSGLTLGGGFGHLARPFGLACDSLVSVELVDAEGAVLHCSETENADLFWALRGGGGGSLGVATRYQFRTHGVPRVVTFGIAWTLPAERALTVLKAWQQWIPQAPEAITCFLRVTANQEGQVTLHGAGQTIASDDALRAELRRICVEKPESLETTPTDFLGAVVNFRGTPGYKQVYMKGKSDYVYETMSDEGMLALFSGLRNHPEIVATFDGYGGTVGKVAPDATAFCHRKAVSSVQYVSQFEEPRMARALVSMRIFHKHLRPHFSGKAYVNYPDLDLADYAAAYWGDNLARLKRVKAARDPDNLFRHAQSIPLI
jgi:hypothetical protein